MSDQSKYDVFLNHSAKENAPARETQEPLRKDRLKGDAAINGSFFASYLG